MSHLLCSNPRLLYAPLGVEMSYVAMKVWKEISPPDWGGANWAEPSWHISFSLSNAEHTDHVKIFLWGQWFPAALQDQGNSEKVLKTKAFYNKIFCFQKSRAECGGHERERESTCTNITDTHSGVREKTGYTGFLHFYQFANHLW